MQPLFVRPLLMTEMGPLSERTMEEYARQKQRAPKILVIDDKLDTVLLLRELLTSRGYEVLTATDADEGKELVHSERPDLVLLDVVMPGKSGYDVCRELKEDPMTRLIPVVMITGLSDRDDRVRPFDQPRFHLLEGGLVEPRP